MPHRWDSVLEMRCWDLLAGVTMSLPTGDLEQDVVTGHEARGRQGLRMQSLPWLCRFTALSLTTERGAQERQACRQKWSRWGRWWAT